jgi:hypothetical protein
VTGASLTLTPGCQSGSGTGVLTRSYTATPGHVTFIADHTFADGVSTLVGEYVKR